VLSRHGAKAAVLQAAAVTKRDFLADLLAVADEQGVVFIE
jgi:hypothetical protein